MLGELTSVTPVLDSLIQVSGPVEVTAKNWGLIVAVAATMATKLDDKSPTGGTSTSGTGSSQSGSGSTDPGKYGLAVSGSFAVVGYDSPRDPNDKAGIGDVVQAIINTSGTINANAGGGTNPLTVTANNDTYIGAVSGGYASTKGDMGKGSTGVAGAASVINIIGETLATVRGGTNGLSITAGSMVVEAKRTGLIASLAAGVALSGDKTQTAAAYGIAGSVSINTITNNTEASTNKITLATLTGTTDSRIKARDESIIAAVTAGIAVASSATPQTGAGFGAAVAVNTLNTTQKALVDSTYIRQAGAANFSVTAESANPGPANARIVAIAASAGISGGIGVSGMVAVNTITGSTEAAMSNSSSYIYNNADTSKGAVSVTATDTSWLISIGAAYGAGDSIAAGIGVSVNNISCTTKARIDATAVNNKQ